MTPAAHQPIAPRFAALAAEMRATAQARAAHGGPVAAFNALVLFLLAALTDAFGAILHHCEQGELRSHAPRRRSARGTACGTSGAESVRTPRSRTPILARVRPAAPETARPHATLAPAPRPANIPRRATLQSHARRAATTLDRRWLSKWRFAAQPTHAYFVTISNRSGFPGTMR